MSVSLSLSPFMWPQWLKSPKKIFSTQKSSPPNFRCSSFKDVQSLSKEDSELPRKKKSPIFHRVRRSKSLIPACWSHNTASPPVTPLSSQPSITLPNSKSNRCIILYFTSLRVVRKTFEDCRAVKSILNGFRVPVDERDLSMDSSYLDELREIVGGFSWTPPRVFIGGRYIGGAEEIRRLDETGELKKLIERLPMVDPSGCDLCGGHRYLVCDQCNGSHKVYTSENREFRTCWACNVNGLIRCSSC